MYLTPYVLFLGCALCKVQIPKYRMTDSVQRKLALEVLKVSPINTAVSALLLRFPLCKLAADARRRGKVELMIALGFYEEDMIQTCYTQFQRDLQFIKRSDLMTATMMYLNEKIDVENSFVENSTVAYGFRVEKVGFSYTSAATKIINNWIEQSMLKRVKDIVDVDDINSNTSLVILNAAHFKGTWEKPFFPQLTSSKKFRNRNGTVSKVQTMTSVDDLLFLEDPNLQIKMVTLPFLETSITFVMPTSVNGLPKFIDKMLEDHNVMKNLKGSMRRKVLTLSIPKFKIKSYVDWSGFLRLAGINRIFNETHSDLNHMLKSSRGGNIYLSIAKQKVFMDLDEFGAMRMTTNTESRDFQRLQAHIDKADEFILDRPFYFAVSFRNKVSEYDILNGAYYGPDEL